MSNMTTPKDKKSGRGAPTKPESIKATQRLRIRATTTQKENYEWAGKITGKGLSGWAKEVLDKAVEHLKKKEGT